MAQTVKSLLTMQETWIPSLDWEDPLEKGMATHSSTLACEIPWTEDASGLQSKGSQESDTTERRALLCCILGKARFPILLILGWPM